MTKESVQRLVVGPLVVCSCLSGDAQQAVVSRSGPPARTSTGWVWLDAGSFEMGCVPADRECHADETPRHPVTLTRGFFMMQTEVTTKAFSEAFALTGIRMPRQPVWNEGGNQPVVNVTWDEARLVCERAFRGRLPTEAEWEYAARGGRSNDKYPWGNTYDTSMVNGRDGVRNRDNWPQASPVGSFAPNHRGLFDVLGNVWEWTADVFSETYYARSPPTDPGGPASGELRSVRGGSWDSAPRQVRLSSRTGVSVHARFPLYVGFRCAADGPDAPPAVAGGRAVSETSPQR